MPTDRYIQELRDIIRRLHGVESTHVGSVPVKETFQGKTVWDGILWRVAAFVVVKAIRNKNPNSRR